MFESFFDALSRLREDAENTFAQLTTKDEFQRVVAVAAWIMYADGTVSAAEKEKLGDLLRMKFPQFEGKMKMDVISHVFSLVDFDFDFGKGDLKAMIVVAKGDDKESDLLVRVGILIGSTDGNFDDNEQSAVREVIQLLGLSAAQYGL